MTIATLTFLTFLSFQTVSIDTAEMDLNDFIRLIAKTANMNVVLHPAVEGKVNLMVTDAPWEEVLDLVLKNYGLGIEIEGNTMRIAPVETLPLQTRIYFLKYVRAETVAPILARMVSPRGSVIIYPPRNAVIVRDIWPKSVPR